MNKIYYIPLLLSIIILLWLYNRTITEQFFASFYDVFAINTPYYITDTDTLQCLTLGTDNQVYMAPPTNSQNKMQQWIPVREGATDIITGGNSACRKVTQRGISYGPSFLLKNTAVSPPVYLNVSFNAQTNAFVFNIIKYTTTITSRSVNNVNSPIFNNPTNNFNTCNNSNFRSGCPTCTICLNPTTRNTGRCIRTHRDSIGFKCVRCRDKTDNKVSNDQALCNNTSHPLYRLFIQCEQYEEILGNPYCIETEKIKECSSCRLWSGRYNGITCQDVTNSYPTMKRFLFDKNQLRLFDTIKNSNDTLLNRSTLQYLSFNGSELTVKTSNPSTFYFVSLSMRTDFYNQYMRKQQLIPGNNTLIREMQTNIYNFNKATS